MSYKTTKEFWDNQAERYNMSPEATTNDFYMRQIEINCLNEIINDVFRKIKTIVDIGCGNGFSTLKLAEKYPDLIFNGYDYSKKMIENAIIGKKEKSINNIDF